MHAAHVYEVIGYLALCWFALNALIVWALWRAAR